MDSIEQQPKEETTSRLDTEIIEPKSDAESNSSEHNNVYQNEDKSSVIKEENFTNSDINKTGTLPPNNINKDFLQTQSRNADDNCDDHETTQETSLNAQNNKEDDNTSNAFDDINDKEVPEICKSPKDSYKKTTSLIDGHILNKECQLVKQQNNVDQELMSNTGLKNVFGIGDNTTEECRNEVLKSAEQELPKSDSSPMETSLSNGSNQTDDGNMQNSNSECFQAVDSSQKNSMLYTNKLNEVDTNCDVKKVNIVNGDNLDIDPHELRDAAKAKEDGSVYDSTSNLLATAEANTPQKFSVIKSVDVANHEAPESFQISTKEFSELHPNTYTLPTGDDTSLSDATNTNLNSAEMLDALGRSSLVAEEVDKRKIENFDENRNRKNCVPPNTQTLVDDSHSSVASYDSDSSTCSTSSSQQLIIDHPIDDVNVNATKVAPLKLSLKRKLCKNESEDETEVKRVCSDPAKDSLEESSTVMANTKKSLLLERLTQTQMPADKPPVLGTAIKQPIGYNCNDSTIGGGIQQQLKEQQNCRKTKSKVSETRMATTECLGAIFRNSFYEQKNTYFRCKACNTYHQGWHFFNHVSEKHERYICLYCVSLFPTPEKLSVHMENTHDLEQNHVNTDGSWSTKLKENRKYELTCCSCQRVFGSNEKFVENHCSEQVHTCSLCGQRGKHTNECNSKKNADNRKKKTKQKSAPVNFTATTITQEAHSNPNDCSIQLAQHNFQESHKINNETTFPPSMLNHTDNIDDAAQIDNEFNDGMVPLVPKLIVPKIMLRVPKEFQKSVDAEISSTDSEEFDDEDELEDRNSSAKSIEGLSPSTHKNSLPLDLETNSASETAMDNSIAVDATPIYVDATPTESSQCVDSESIDATRIKVASLLEKIEKINADIIQTKKEIMPATHKPQEETLNASNVSREHAVLVPPATDHSWSPTPPASPNSHWYTPRGTPTRSVSLINQVDNAAHHLQDDQALKERFRRNTIGSDTMDIDDSISGNNETAGTNKDDDSLAEPENRMMSSAPDECKNEASNEEPHPLLDVTEATENETAEEPHLNTSNSSIDVKEQTTDSDEQQPPQRLPPADGIEVANEDTAAVDLQLDRPLDKFETIEFVRLCLKAVYPICLYCNHARRIAVNGKSLVLHMIAQHRFTATVDSITAEELKPETIVGKLKGFLELLESEYLNSSSYCTVGEGSFTNPFNERVYECFQCRFVTSTHKELYMHNRRLHIKTSILCFMCRANFFSFSELLCHICPGEPNKTSIFDVKYRCCLCDTTNLPSPFRLMVHLRKKHFACDVCLEDCRDQSKLSSHVWKHKLHHLCYRCGIAYRNKQDITKHLYWKHGTESINCKRCLQKRWRHVYHFCVPPTSFVCEECKISFSRAMYLEVHKRIHTGDFRYPCMEESCEEKFVSRRLLLKHMATHQVGDASLNEKMASECDKTEQKADIVDRKVGADIYNEIKSEEVEPTTSLDFPHNTESSQTCNNSSTEKTKMNEKPSENVDMSGEVMRKKRKKNKRSKESLEDLNLIAPNLSESDSSDDSGADESQNKLCNNDSMIVPKVMLSPSSESDNDQLDMKNKLENSENNETADKLPDIWKNLLLAQNGGGSHLTTETLSPPLKVESDYTDDNYPQPKYLHVSVSDHDYCKLIRPPTPIVPDAKVAESAKVANNSDFSSDSSSESSSSSDSSSCSCGSNCSCSSSDSDSSSSSSSSDDSDSSSVSNASKKRQRKKTSRKKSVSPVKTAHRLKANTPKQDEQQISVTNTSDVRAPSPPKPPPFYESDFETAESETDEEFYDEHPQKLATELLAEKRAALMAQTRLSPSHNFDIVENSRPSTPSLPEDMSAYTDKRTKTKKKKRDRKSTIKSNQKISGGMLLTSSSTSGHLNSQDNSGRSDDVHGISSASFDSQDHLTPQAPTLYPNSTLLNTTQDVPYNPRSLAFQNSHISEGSSCSEADGTLKRSKRTRRPNKFYGYTSDDENMSTVLAPPLLVGMQLIKPQPPPQLTWAKEDLPTPSKSILNPKKTRNSKNTSTPLGSGGYENDDGDENKRKKPRRTAQSGGGKSSRRNANKKNARGAKAGAANLPPIPTLKIRPSQLLAASNQNTDDNSDTSSGSDVEINVTSNTTNSSQIWNTVAATAESAATAVPLKAQPEIPQQTNILQSIQVLPPVPEATAFKQKIPPALLPNPDFATLQYFKANNIRYPIRPPAGARLAREGEAVYCYCRCPYDEVSEMIACDGDNCLIEWFHFECVGIMVAPQGKWFCAECRPKYSEELYPQKFAANE